MTQAPAIDPAKCTRCGACVDACPRGAIVSPSASTCAKCVKYCSSMEVPCSHACPSISVERCDRCLECLAACPSGAIR